MGTQTLFTAFAIAQARTPGIAAMPTPTPARFEPGNADETTLITALRNCATDRDQIIQRRIGLYPE